MNEKLIVTKLIIFISNLGRFYLSGKIVYFLILILLSMFIVGLQQSIYTKPRSVKDLNWDEFYLKSIVTTPSRYRRRGLKGFSITEGKKVSYEYFSNRLDFDDYSGILRKKFKVGWLYEKGPIISSIYPFFRTRIVFFMEGEGGVLISFNEQVEKNELRISRTVFVIKISILIFMVLVFPATLYVFLRRKKYVR